MISDPLGVFVALAIVVYVAIRLEETLRFTKMLGSVLLAIVLAAVLANVGVLPSTSPTYDMLGGMGVSLGIALILLGVNIRSVVQAGPRMLFAFGLGAVGTISGALLGSALLHDAIGGKAWKLAGQYTGTYIGGGVNMVAVGRGLDTSSDVFSAAIAADNVTTAVWMIVCFGLPGVLAPWWNPTRAAGGVSQAPTTSDDIAAQDFTSSLRAVTLADVAALVLIASTAVLASSVIADAIPGVPAVLWLTTIVLLLAQVPAIRRLSGGPLWGNYVLQVFLASIGAQSIIREIVRLGPVIFWFTLVVVGVHGVLLFGVGRLARIDVPTLAVASMWVGQHRQWPWQAPEAIRIASCRGLRLDSWDTPSGIMQVSRSPESCVCCSEG